MDSSDEKKIKHLKNKLKIKEMQLSTLLDITNSINHNFDVENVIEKYKTFVKDELAIEKLVLFCKIEDWQCVLYYGLSDEELINIDLEKDILPLQEITSISQIQTSTLTGFDIIVPVYQGQKALAYLLLGDVENNSIHVSSTIKHLNFLQLLTNIIASAIENQQLTKKLIKEEQEKRQFMEEQNSILEELVNERTHQLKNEKEEADRLLNNILPKGIAAELKEKGYTTPAGYKSASILFTDFKDFTTISSQITPKKLVSELNDIFKKFDFIIEKFGLEKIKTIGDAYMAADGLPEETKGHAIQCVRAGLAMINYINDRNQTHDMKWQMRIGVNSGPLIAGVVGTKKFTYDIWGDAVNTAARMESNSEAGKINITKSTFKLVNTYFECEHRGSHFVKGKGETEMYFILASKRSKRYTILREKIITKLESDLPKSLYYHGVHHTKDVLEAVFTLAVREEISFEELDLLLTATLLHDTGFLFQYADNEEKACELANTILPEHGYSSEEIEVINGIIMATKLPQNPKTKLETLICDADLDYLGRSDFEEISENLFKELNANGVPLSKDQWQKKQKAFLEEHTYFTSSAKLLRNDGKLKQLEKLT